MTQNLHIKPRPLLCIPNIQLPILDAQSQLRILKIGIIALYSTPPPCLKSATLPKYSSQVRPPPETLKQHQNVSPDISHSPSYI